MAFSDYKRRASVRNTPVRFPAFYIVCSQYFSSPHMVFVRERIRINGEPLSEEAFAAHFWELHSKIEESQVQHVQFFIFVETQGAVLGFMIWGGMFVLSSCCCCCCASTKIGS